MLYAWLTKALALVSFGEEGTYCNTGRYRHTFLLVQGKVGLWCQYFHMTVHTAKKHQPSDGFAWNSEWIPQHTGLSRPSIFYEVSNLQIDNQRLTNNSSIKQWCKTNVLIFRISESLNAEYYSLLCFLFLFLLDPYKKNSFFLIHSLF